METTRADLEHALCDRRLDLDGLAVQFNPEAVLRAAAKYGRAVAHTVRLYRRIERTMDGRGFDFEMSVDETDSPTSLAEHVFIASELRRLKVRWVSLAPRYVGTFEKGVDYIGNLPEFEASLTGHAAVARAYGPYKLSLHSGSDKFSIYPIASRLAGDRVHLKTAGTSYLERCGRPPCWTQCSSGRSCGLPSSATRSIGRPTMSRPRPGVYRMGPA